MDIKTDILKYLFVYLYVFIFVCVCLYVYVCMFSCLYHIYTFNDIEFPIGSCALRFRPPPVRPVAAVPWL